MTTTLALTGATLVDGTGADPASGQVVVVEGGRIREVVRRPPPGAEVVDLDGCTLIPGLIDAHVHLGLSSDLQGLLTGQVSAAEIAAAIFGTAERALREGFTTVRDVGGIDAGVVRAISSGAVLGPRVLTSGPILSQTGGGGHYAPPWEAACLWESRDIPGLLGMSLLADGADAMRYAAREAFRRGAGFLKLMVTGAVLAHGDELDHTQLCVEEIAVAVQEARARDTYVTAVNGLAVGLGAELAIAADLRIAAAEAEFAFLEVARGLYPTNGVLFFLPRMVGHTRALDLLLSGERLSAPGALAAGLVSRVVPGPDLLASATHLAQTIATAAPLPVTMIKRHLRESWETDLEGMLALETEGALACLRSHDLTEGVTAFAEQRPPGFHGH